MSTTNPRAEKRTGHTIRPRTITLGIDAEDCTHIYRTQTETVHVVTADGEREHVESVAGRPVEDWMSFVADRRGWARRDYGLGLVELAQRSLDA